MPYYLLLCERATGIILQPDCATRFQRMDDTTELPYVPVASLEDAESRARGIAIMYPEVEVSLWDEQKNYIKEGSRGH